MVCGILTNMTDLPHHVQKVSMKNVGTMCFVKLPYHAFSFPLQHNHDIFSFAYLLALSSNTNFLFLSIFNVLKFKYTRAINIESEHLVVLKKLKQGKDHKYFPPQNPP